MQKLNPHQVAVCLIGAVLAFRQQRDAELEKQETDIALMPEEARQEAATAHTLIPAEQPAEEYWSLFTDFVREKGLASFLHPSHSDISCFASLAKDEPSFTLMGRDILASILVKHWASLAVLSEDVRAIKIERAEDTAAKMEEFQPQYWPD